MCRMGLEAVCVYIQVDIIKQSIIVRLRITVRHILAVECIFHRLVGSGTVWSQTIL